MMLLLGSDVSSHRRNVGFTDAEYPISGLPGEVREAA